MYIERKAGELIGTASIGRVTFSKTGKTVYYKGLGLLDQRPQEGWLRRGHMVVHQSSMVDLTFIGADTFFVTGLEGAVEVP
jgi:hypothetical protein